MRQVHQALGPGLLEQIYEVCFCHELHKRALVFHRQVSVPITYDGIKFDEGLRLDVFVEELVICELKAVEEMRPVFTAQLLSQLKLTGKRLGFSSISMCPKSKMASNESSDKFFLCVLRVFVSSC